MQEKALKLRNRTLGETHPDTPRFKERLALIHRRAGCLDQGKETRLQAMNYRMQLTSFGDKHPEMYRIIEALRDTYCRLGDTPRGDELAAL